MVLPGNVLVVELAVEANDRDTDTDLRTCLIRGWVEVLHDAVPHGSLTPEGNLPDSLYTGTTTIYRITDSGWSVIRRDRLLAISAVIFAAASFALSMIIWISTK
jgi:hypothetical protein